MDFHREPLVSNGRDAFETDRKGHPQAADPGGAGNILENIAWPAPKDLVGHRVPRGASNGLAVKTDRQDAVIDGQRFDGQRGGPQTTGGIFG
jgi:hypothetical protein